MLFQSSCRVKIYPDLNAYQIELIDKGHNVLWIAVNADQENLFESTDIKDVVAYANKHPEVEYISKYVQL